MGKIYVCDEADYYKFVLGTYHTHKEASTIAIEWFNVFHMMIVCMKALLKWLQTKC